jgi:hypothetical protein
VKINFQPFINKYKNQTSFLGYNYIISKKEVMTHYTGSWLKPPELKEVIDKKFNKIVFGFNNSIIVLDDGSVISFCTGNSVGETFLYKQVLSFTVKESGFFGKGVIMDNSKKVGNVICNDIEFGIKIFKDFKKFLKENPPSLISNTKENVKQKDTKTKPIKSKTKKTTTVKSSTPTPQKKVEKGNTIEKDSLLTVLFYDEILDKEKKIQNLELEKWIVKENKLHIYKKNKKKYYEIIDPRRHLNYSFNTYSVSDNNKDVYECSKKLFNNLHNLTHNEKFKLSHTVLLKDIKIEGEVYIKKIKKTTFQFGYRKNQFYNISDKEKEMFFMIPTEDVIIHTGLKLENQELTENATELEIINHLRTTPYISNINLVSYIHHDNIESKHETTLTKLKELRVIIEKGEDYFKGIETTKTELIGEMDKYQSNKDGVILDFNLFYNILKHNQTKINTIDREYVQKFVKLNNYLKEKSSNLSVIINKIIYNLENEHKSSIIKREEEFNFFKGLVYSYNLMVNHSIVMLTSLVEDDTITFYETYEVFDKMNVFVTNWENEVNNKLSEINESLVDLNFSIRGLMNQMRSIERNIVNGLQSINTSIGSLEISVNKQLSETNSRLKYENLTNYYKKSTTKGIWDWFDGPSS